MGKKWGDTPSATLMVLHLNKVQSPSSKDALCQVCLKLVQGSGEDF